MVSYIVNGILLKFQFLLQAYVCNCYLCRVHPAVFPNSFLICLFANNGIFIPFQIFNLFISFFF